MKVSGLERLRHFEEADNIEIEIRNALEKYSTAPIVTKQMKEHLVQLRAKALKHIRCLENDLPQEK